MRRPAKKSVVDDFVADSGDELDGEDEFVPEAEDDEIPVASAAAPSGGVAKKRISRKNFGGEIKHLLIPFVLL